MPTTIPRPSRWMLLVAMGLMLLVNACSSLPSPPPTMALLTLDVPPLPSMEGARKESVLRFDHVEAVASLRDTHVLYRRGGPVVHRFARHRWQAAPAELIEQALMASMVTRLPYAHVVPAGQGMVSDLALSLTLIRLEQAFTPEGQSDEHLEILVQLTDLERGRVIGSHLFRYREAVSEATAEGGAMAAGIALARFLIDLKTWLHEVDP